MLRLGCGAGFSSDRLEPAIDLAEKGRLDYLVFETCAERTLAFGHRDRQARPQARLQSPARGTLARRAQALQGQRHAHRHQHGRCQYACRRRAGHRCRPRARPQGPEGRGGDRRRCLRPDHAARPGFSITTTGWSRRSACRWSAPTPISASTPSCRPWRAGADVVITGRVADPSLFLAPIVHRYGWRRDDWPALGRGTLVGHLMECGMQITGGYFADPGLKDVPRLADCGYPIAEVAEDGSAVITKLADAGGLVSMRTVKEQLLYEVHDPARYLTPDVTADFSNVEVRETRPGPRRRDQRQRHQAAGHAESDGRVRSAASMPKAGSATPGPMQRPGRASPPTSSMSACAATPQSLAEMRIDLVGLNALHQTAHRAGASSAAEARPGTGQPKGHGPVGHAGSVLASGKTGQPEGQSEDMRVRVAMRSADRAACETMLWEVESMLCCGPAGGGGYRGQITPSVITHSALIHRDQVEAESRGAGGMTTQSTAAPIRRIKLHEIAHARAGDKGNTSNVSVWVYDPGDYRLVKEQLTRRAHQGGISRRSSKGPVHALRARPAARPEFRDAGRAGGRRQHLARPRQPRQKSGAS